MSSQNEEEGIAKVQELLSKLSLITTTSASDCNDGKQDDSSHHQQNDDLSAETSMEMKRLIQDFQSQNKGIHAAAIFTALTPFLFLRETSSITQSAALQILIQIISTNTNDYMLPAMTSVLNYVQQTILSRDSDGANKFNISQEVIYTILQQVQHTSTAIANQASQILYLLCTKLPSSMQQRNTTSAVLILLYNYTQRFIQELAMANSSANTNNAKSNRGNVSILLVRNLSLMVDILIATTNTHAYMKLQALSSSLPLSSVNLDSSTDTSYTATTILDPILQLLTTTSISDPLLEINIFEIIEKISCSENRVLHLWIEEYMTDILLSKVGFCRKDDTMNNSRYVEVDAVGNIDVFSYNSALAIMSKCCCRCHRSDGNSDGGNISGAIAEESTLTPRMMINIFKHILHSCLNDSRDEVEKIHYVNSLATFLQGDRTRVGAEGDGENDERINLVLQENDIIEFWFSLKQGNGKFKAVLLNTIAQTLRCKKFDDDNSSNFGTPATGAATYSFISDEMCMSTYKKIGEVNGGEMLTTTELLMKQIKSSIIETRLAVYEVFKSVIVGRPRNSGGSFLLVSHGGLLEWMLSRDVEMTKEGKELKFDIVNGILESDLKGLLNESIVRLLERYVDQGPHFVPGVGGDVLLE